jgi:hypothetical protein
VGQVGGRSHLVGIRQDDSKGKIEQVFSNKEAESQVKSSRNFGAAFASRGQSILFGSAEGCALVWDKNGNVAWGLDHGGGEHKMLELPRFLIMSVQMTLFKRRL